MFRRELRKRATPQEIILWSRIRRKSLGVAFRRQYSVGNYILDFFCIEKKIAIEIDGWQHKEADNYDKKRSEYLEGLGITVLRFWNNEVNDNLEGVILRIQEYIVTTSPQSPP